MKCPKIITGQPKCYGRKRYCPNITDIKSVTIEHQKTSHKLSKTIKQGKKFSQVVGARKSSNNPLYSETTKRETFWTKKIQE